MSTKQKMVTTILFFAVLTAAAVMIFGQKQSVMPVSRVQICHSLTEYIKYLESSGLEKRDVTVAVIDSGCSGLNQYNERILVGYNILQGCTDTADTYGHGTRIAALILSNTPDYIKLMPLKVVDEDGYAKRTDVCEALEYAAANGADIINLSLNAILDGTEEDNRLNTLVEELAKQGILVVVSAGNTGDDVCNLSPASVGNAIVVAAADRARTPYLFSGYGETVDFCSLGEFADESGTSYSAAYVTSAAAILKMYGVDHMREKGSIEKILDHYAENYGGDNSVFGKGYIWLDSFVTDAEIDGGRKGGDPGLSAFSVKQEDDLGLDIMRMNWIAMEPEELERYLLGTDRAYVGMFLKSLSEEEMLLLNEKCPLLHSDVSVSVCNWDETTRNYTTEKQEIYDFAQYCISEYENNIQQMSVSYWMVNNTKIVFYISNNDRTIKYRCELSGKIRGTEAAIHENNILGRDPLIFTVSGSGDSSFPMPQLGAGGIKNYVADTTSRWVVLSGADVDNGNISDSIIHNSEHGMINDEDKDSIHYGLSIPFTGMVLDAKTGYHCSPQTIAAYKYGTNDQAVKRQYMHLTPTGWNFDNTAEIMYIGANFQELSGRLTATCYSGRRDIGEEVYTICPNPTILSKQEAAKYYDITEHEIYRLTNRSSFDAEGGNMVLNCHIYHLSGLELYTSEDNKIINVNDVVEYVIAQTPNHYNIILNAASGTFTNQAGLVSNSASVTTVYDRTDNNKLSAAPQREGYIFAGWYTEPDGGMEVWDINGEALEGTPFWQDGIWKYTTEDWSEKNNTLTFYAKWIPDRNSYTYTIRFDANGGNGSIPEISGLKYAQKYSLPVNTVITKERSLFIDWNTMPDGSGTFYDNGSDFYYEPRTNGEIVTLYAQWTPVIHPSPDLIPEEYTIDHIVYGWTNEHIPLKFTAVDGGCGMHSLILYEGNSGNILKNGVDHLEYTVTEEGIFHFTLIATDNCGKSSTLYVTTKIDYTTPEGKLDVVYDGQALDIIIEDIIEENPGNPQNASSGCKEAWVVLEGIDADGNIVAAQNEPLILQTPDNIFTGAAFGGTFLLDDSFNLETENINITAYVKDIAGNYLPALGTETVSTFSLKTDVERCLGTASKWKAGEAGIVHAHASAYVDRIEIVYPSEWVALDHSLANRVFDYSGIREYNKKEDDLFYIPLDVADGEYTIIVYAYKDTNVKSREFTITVSASILDELRTRLR